MTILVKKTSKRLIKHNFPIIDNVIMLDLKGNSVGKRNIAKNREIITLAKPTSLLKTKVDTRSFQYRPYQEIDWLCASV